MPLSARERTLVEACQHALDYFARPRYHGQHDFVTMGRQLEAALAQYTDEELPLPWLRERIETERRRELVDRR